MEEEGDQRILWWGARTLSQRITGAAATLHTGVQNTGSSSTTQHYSQLLNRTDFKVEIQYRKVSRQRYSTDRYNVEIQYR